MRASDDRRPARSPDALFNASSGVLARVEQFFRNGENELLLSALSSVNLAEFPAEIQARLAVLEGSALYDLGNVTGAIGAFRRALEVAQKTPPDVPFAAA